MELLNVANDDDLARVFGDMIENGKRIVFLGPGSSDTTAELMQGTNMEAFQTPILSLSEGSTANTSEYVKRITVSTEQKSEAILSLIKAAEWRRIGFWHEFGEFGFSLYRDMEILLEQHYTRIESGLEVMDKYSEYYDDILNRDIFIVILHGKVETVKNILDYGIANKYIGQESDGSLLFILSSSKSCDQLLVQSSTLNPDMTSDDFKMHMKGHICVESELLIDEYFLNYIWNPATTSDMLTDEEKEMTGYDDWNDGNISRIAPLAYDTVLWLVKGVQSVCVELESAADISSCLNYLGTTDGSILLLNHLDTETFQGVSGFVEKDPKNNIQLKYLGTTVSNVYYPTWIPFASGLGESGAALGSSSLESIIWPSGTSELHTDMHLPNHDTSDYIAIGVGVFGSILLLTLLNGVLLIKKRQFSLGIFEKVDAIIMLILSFISVFGQTTNRLLIEKTTIVCILPTLSAFCGFMVAVWGFLCVSRFRSILLNTGLSKTDSSSKFFLPSWMFLILVVTSMFFVASHKYYAGFGDIMRVNDPESGFDIFRDMCKSSSFGVQNGWKYYLCPSMVVIPACFCFLGISISCLRVKNNVGPSLSKTNRLRHVKFLQYSCALMVVILTLLSLYYILLPLSSVWSSERSKNEVWDENDSLYMSANHVHSTGNWGAVVRIWIQSCAVSVAILNELLFSVRQFGPFWRKSRKTKLIYDRESVIPDTSYSVDQRLELNEAFIPACILDILHKESMNTITRQTSVESDASRFRRGSEESSNLMIVKDSSSPLLRNQTPLTLNQNRFVGIPRNQMHIKPSPKLLAEQKAKQRTARSHRSHPLAQEQHITENESSSSSSRSDDKSDDKSYSGDCYDDEFEECIISGPNTEMKDNLEDYEYKEYVYTEEEREKYREEHRAKHGKNNNNNNNKKKRKKNSNKKNKQNQHNIKNNNNNKNNKKEKEKAPKTEIMRGKSRESHLSSLITEVAKVEETGTYFDKCRKFVALLRFVSPEVQLQIWCSLREELTQLKRKHLFEQQHVKELEERLQYNMCKLEMMSVRLKRLLPEFLRSNSVLNMGKGVCPVRRRPVAKIDIHKINNNNKNNNYNSDDDDANSGSDNCDGNSSSGNDDDDDDYDDLTEQYHRKLPYRHMDTEAYDDDETDDTNIKNKSNILMNEEYTDTHTSVESSEEAMTEDVSHDETTDEIGTGDPFDYERQSIGSSFEPLTPQLPQ
eukprot:TRINITY_DN991_c4_g1_i1.p1 TRINITY_DN991_c4_g1~~TRINITY_DN991_c4_g1_i1.p1  ORF type:complete len:1284 (+),score=308.13 TRINITY_DN991_c4_g1_i1:215-3853(+)